MKARWKKGRELLLGPSVTDDPESCNDVCTLANNSSKKDPAGAMAIGCRL